MELQRLVPEKLVTNSMHNYATKLVLFVFVENVAGTNGSVIPLFLEQLNKTSL